MRKRRTLRLPALLLAAWLLALQAMPAVHAAQAEGGEITVSTPEELRSLAERCSLDTWSRGKTVRLAADLDLDGVEFAPIPTFGGTFLGQGHTISGLSVTAAGSVQGLIRYLQPGGVVRDLTVEGTVAPGGTRSTVGGIVGDNSGTLEGCAFHGTVRGKNMVGGITGRNNASGEVIACTVSGSVSGESATGGVAGRNLGLLMQCENSAGVNLTQTQAEPSLELLEGDAAAEGETDRLLGGCTDTGGIVGWSGGVVQSCVNTGAVGYPHVGYNTGGVAGRQSGYLAGCVNSGTVHGRKDVGGVVGQGEPHLVADPGGDGLERLRAELDTLQTLVDRALDDAQNAGDSVSGHLASMGDFAGSARDSTRRLVDRLSDFADENISEINTAAADLTDLLDKMTPALDDLSSAGERLAALARQLDRAIDSAEAAADTGSHVLRNLREAASRLSDAGSALKAASDALEDALKRLLEALKNRGDADAQAEAAAGALRLAEDSAVRLASALKDAAGAAGVLGDILTGGSGDVRLPDLPELPGFKPIDWDKVDLARIKADLEAIAAAVKPAGDHLKSAMDALKQAIDGARPLPGELRAVLERLRTASGSVGDAGTLAGRACAAIGGAVRDYVALGPAEFVPLGEGFRQDSDGLFDALAGLSADMEALNETVQDSSSELIRDLRAVSRQLQAVFDTLLDIMGGLRTAPSDRVDAMIQDTSEEDAAAAREGKVAGCRNTGAVEGDRNVGGVIGSVAIDFDLDPEDDATGGFSFGSTYETKAVLQGCVNLGGVTAKKDCAGGLAGRMDLGTAMDCQNYGPVESTGGDYVGGIVGFGDASVRNCWSKSTLSGGNYVGGIAGWAARLRDCRAIATISRGVECLGAIAGDVDAEGVLSGCCFVDTGVAGVDGVSYAGRAEPISFDAMEALEGVPGDFTAFTLTLTADGETVARIPFRYGEDLSRLQLPAVPEKEGNYGVWPSIEPSGALSDLTLEAEYAPWITLTASEEKRDRLSLALAEGQFTAQAALHVTPSSQTPPQGAAEDAAVWDIALTGSGLGPEDLVPLRLLSSGGAVRQYRNGQWVEVETRRNGQYLLLTMKGTQGTFCIQPEGSGTWKAVLAAAGLGAAALLLAAGLRGRQKRKAVRAKRT